MSGYEALWNFFSPSITIVVPLACHETSKGWFPL